MSTIITFILILCAVVLLYLLLVGLLYGLHERFVYRPSRLDTQYEFDFEQQFEEISIPDEQMGLSIHGLYFPATAPEVRGLVIYFHGNRGNLQRWGQVAGDFTGYGYHIVIIDYPGYGKSRGNTNEETFYRSAALTYEWVKQRHPELPLVIYGRSIGSGPAAWLAARQQVQQMILETPIPNIPALFRAHAGRLLVPFTPRPEFPVEHYLSQVSCPVTIFHGTDDWVVPYRAACRLRDHLSGADRFITIEGGSHNNLRTYEQYQHTLRELLTFS